MRYCGNCGAPLSAGELADGVCARCGTRITPTGDIAEPYDTLPAESLGGAPTNPTGSGSAVQYPSRDAGPPRWTVARRAQASLLPPSSPLPVILGAAVLVLLLAMGILLAFALRHNATTTNLNGNGNNSSSNQGSSTHSGGSTTTSLPGHHKTPTPLGQPTAAPATTPTPQATSTPQPGDTPTPIVIPTDTPVPAPVITLSTNTIDVPNAACLSTAGGNGSFSVSNTGGGQMNWTATTDDISYLISPNSGSLNGGAPAQNVVVSNIHSSGSLSVSAVGAANSPQPVTVTCGGIP